MTLLSSRAQRWLKAAHLTFAGLWLAGATILLLVTVVLEAVDGRQLYGIHQTAKFIDDFVIIPAAMCTLLSGVCYSLATRWGWFKHGWITAKWIITVAGILVGTFALGPSLNALPPMAESLGLGALSDEQYQLRRAILLLGAPLQVGSLLLAVFLSVLKIGRARNREATP